VAIAYSSKSESGNQSGSNAGAAIYMTVDNSASMTYEMSSSNTALNIAEMRAYYLRKAATGFIDALLPYDNVYLGMQGFFQYASAKQNQPLLSLNDPANLSVFHRLFDADHFVANYANFNSSVVSGGNWTLDPTEILGLGPGTNIGDGIRASFYSFTSDARSLGIDNLNKYMILLSDGEPNASTYDVSILGPTFDPSYVKSLGAQAANSLFYGGKLYATANGELENSASTETLRHRAADEAADRERGMAYALKMAEIAHMSGLVKDFYIVGIAELSQATLKLLAQSFGITDDLYDSRVFSVSDEIQLRHSLEAAAAGIAFDLEELLGKSLLDGIQD
jgi:hypothetical protein